MKEWAEKAEESTKDLDGRIRDAISGAFEKVNLPTRDDIVKMEKKLQSISARLRKLEGGGKGEEEA